MNTSFVSERSRYAAALVGLSILLSSCASPQRPKELVALEKLHESPGLSAEDRRAFDLLAGAEDLLLQSSSKWDAGDRKNAVRLALQGQIKMKTGIAIIQTERTRVRLAAVAAEQTAADDELSRIREQTEATAEEIALLERLAESRTRVSQEHKSLADQLEATRKAAGQERQRLTAALMAERMHFTAAEDIRRAEAAMKTAEAVACPVYATARYAVAVKMLQDAHKTFDLGQWQEASTRAAMVASEVDKAIEKARPQFETAQAASNLSGRDRALESDASAIPDIQVRREAEGDLRRLILLFKGMFREGDATLRPKGIILLDRLTDLLNRYPTYPIQITGHAGPRASIAERPALALARANAIYWSLSERGLDAKRMLVEGATTSAAGATPLPKRDVPAIDIEVTLFYYKPANSEGASGTKAQNPKPRLRDAGSDGPSP